MIFFVDTGILLRVFDRKDIARPSIVEVFRVLRANGDVLATSTQNVREFWNVSTRPATARGGYGRTVEKTANWLQNLRRLLQVLPETAQTLSIWIDLAEQHRVAGSQVHDAHLVAIMLSHGVSEMLTLNHNDFQRFPEIHAMTPSQFLLKQ